MKSVRPILALALLALTLHTAAAARALAQADAAAVTAAAATAAAGGPKFRDGEVLIQFEKGADVDGVLNALSAQEKEVVAAHGNGPLVLAELPPGLAVAEAVGAFSHRPGVRFAEPNWRYTKSLVPNDALWSSAYMWGMKAGFGSQATSAWDNITDCSSVYVGVVDEGIQYTHPDLAANMWTNAGEVDGDGIDNDSNGYVDDVHGYDFVNRRGDVYSAVDGDDHGSHCAGTIGAAGNNGVGVVGVCHKLKLISAKFLGSSGGYLSDAILALDYITNLKTRKGLNIVATSNSWGCGTSCFSQSLLDAINRGHAAGILFIAAAGNEATATPSYPGAFASPAVISVASIQSDGLLSSFSNRGTWVHLGAPGSNIYSTVPSGSYAVYSGTSMATPHVSGAAALYKAFYPSATAAEVKAAILNSATPTASLQNGITSTGGRLNAAAMLAVMPPSMCPGGCASNQFCANNACQACPANCASCTSATTCTACLPGWKGATCATPDCGASCASNQFCQATPSGPTCTTCPTNCLTCTSSTSCGSCLPGFSGPVCGTTCSARGAACSKAASCCSGVCSRKKCA